MCNITSSLLCCYLHFSQQHPSDIVDDGLTLIFYAREFVSSFGISLLHVHKPDTQVERIGNIEEQTLYWTKWAHVRNQNRTVWYCWNDVINKFTKKGCNENAATSYPVCWAIQSTFSSPWQPIIILKPLFIQVYQGTATYSSWNSPMHVPKCEPVCTRKQKHLPCVSKGTIWYHSRCRYRYTIFVQPYKNSNNQYYLCYIIKIS